MNKKINNKQKDGTGMGIAGFVLSLIGFFGWIVPYFSIWFSVAALVFSGLQIKKNKTGLSVAGIVIGILGVLSNLFWLLIVGAIFAGGMI